MKNSNYNRIGDWVVEAQSEDKYGNSVDGDRLIYCSFPDCGCDGARLCMAENGASDYACGRNLEGMYTRKDKEAKVARLGLMDDIMKGKV